jgi:hypothetical protein
VEKQKVEKQKGPESLSDPGPPWEGDFAVSTEK